MQQLLKNSLAATALLSSVSATFAADEGSLLTLGLDIGAIYQFNSQAFEPNTAEKKDDDKKDDTSQDDTFTDLFKDAKKSKGLGLFIEGNASMQITDNFSAGLKLGFSSAETEYVAKCLLVDKIKEQIGEIKITANGGDIDKDTAVFDSDGKGTDHNSEELNANLKKMIKDTTKIIAPEKVEDGKSKTFDLLDTKYGADDITLLKVSDVFSAKIKELLPNMDDNLTVDKLFSDGIEEKFETSNTSITFMPFGQYDAFKSDNLDVSFYAGIGGSYNMYKIKSDNTYNKELEASNMGLDVEIGTKLCYKFSDCLAVSGSIAYNPKSVISSKVTFKEGAENKKEDDKILNPEKDFNLGPAHHIKASIGIQYSI